MRLIAVGLLFSSLLLAQSANRADNRAEEATTQRLQRSAEVFNEIMATPDKGIPRDLLQRAQCAVIVPSMKKAGFVVGAQYGKGFLTCRQGGSWSAPAAIRVEGGSFGFQIGGSETDVIMLVMNQGGEDNVLSSKFTLGGEGEVAAGPVGRSTTAQTDAKLGAEILSWSRSRGAFAGVALTGATLRQDTDSNEALYGKKLDNREIVKGNVAVPPAAQELISALNRYSSSAKG
jgi:SH3 domain-containing YSC84-like protein 1